jgi:transcriptional regulator GlxA family with amidase domain
MQRTTLTVDAVASKVGYLNGGTLRSLYRRRRNRTSAEVRGAAAAWA